MIKTILFDLDDTLFDYIEAEGVALKETLLEVGIEPNDELLERYKAINLYYWRLTETEEITREELCYKRFDDLFKEFGIDYCPKTMNAKYEISLSRACHLIDGAVELLENLVKNYRLFVVSNGGPKIQYGRLKGSGLGKYFEKVFISEEIGFHKPDIRFFEFCFSQIENFNKNETIIVGDNLFADVYGGQNAGLRGVWFNPSRYVDKRQITPDKTITHLSQLYDCIKEFDLEEVKTSI